LSRGCLIVFAKAPRVGRVKTRLVPPLSFEQATAFYDAMLRDVLDATARFAAELDLEPVLAVDPPSAVEELRARTPSAFRIRAQRGAGLGERMANAFAEAFATGAPRVLLRGSDSPGLSAAHVSEMLDALEAEHDLVVCPDRGGGYAMIGQGGPEPGIFDVPMSTPEVLGDTLALAEGLGLRHTVIASTFDLDTAADIVHLDDLIRVKALDLCPRTVETRERLRSDRVL